VRTTLLAGALALVIAGCASQPSSTTPATATATADGQTQQTASNSEIEKQRVREAIKQGYRLVNTNGEELYCRSDWATGSHIQKNTVCLTAQQLDDAHQRIRQTLENPNTPIRNGMP
jgi:type IV pilus biogenesis protein CpaD/CtpE